MEVICLAALVMLIWALVTTVAIFWKIDEIEELLDMTIKLLIKTGRI
mgnify:CR=1 FL=1